MAKSSRTWLGIFLVFVLCALLAVGILMLTGPMIGNTFSSINNSLPVDTTVVVMPTYSPEDSLAGVDAILNRAFSSSLAYNAPNEMTLNDEVVIELLLNPAITEEQLGEKIEQSGQVVTGTVQVTPLTKAELKAQDEAFDILPIHDSAEQPISAAETTRWQWQVTAKKEGTQRLTLVVYMLVKYDGKDYWREVETYRNDIVVNVTFGQRLRAFDWKWLVGLIVASGLIPIVWNWIKKRLAARRKPAN